MSAGEQAKRILKKELSRRQALKAAGFVALGAYVAPKIKTLAIPKAFASVSGTGGEPPPPTTEPPRCVESKITASDPAALNLFGHSVVISGDTAVVGALGDPGGGLLRVGLHLPPGPGRSRQLG